MMNDSKSDIIKLSDLYGMPASYKFSKEEIALIKKHNPKNSFKAKYCLYRKESSKNYYIGFVIDSMPYSPRKGMFGNQWETICERDLTNIEYHEQIENYGTNHRRYRLWMYKDIEALQIEDLKYHVNTPQEFVDLCKKKGYTGNFQLKIDFNDYEND